MESNPCEGTIGNNILLSNVASSSPIVPIQYFRCCEVVEGTLQAACLVDLQAQVQEGVIGTGRVVNTLALDLQKCQEVPG